MMANHTSISHPISQCLEHFKQMWGKKAFLEEFKKEPIFEQSLEEFDMAR